MRVVMLCDGVYPEVKGGVEVHLNRLGHALRGLGHEVLLAPPDLANPRPVKTMAGLPVHYYPPGSTLDPMQFRHEAPPPAMEEFERWLTDVQPDVVMLMDSQ